MRGLETLDLSRSNLGSVPEELGLPELGSITCLDLSRNQLFGSDAVFAVLGALRGLRKLDLSNNFLNGPLSDRSTQLLALEDLNLDSNQLTHLPQDAGQSTTPAKHNPTRFLWEKTKKYPKRERERERER